MAMTQNKGVGKMGAAPYYFMDFTALERFRTSSNKNSEHPLPCYIIYLFYLSLCIFQMLVARQ